MRAQVLNDIKNGTINISASTVAQGVIIALLGAGVFKLVEMHVDIRLINYRLSKVEQVLNIDPPKQPVRAIAER